MKMKFRKIIEEEIEIEIPDDKLKKYRFFTGEFRKPRDGELVFCHETGKFMRSFADPNKMYIIAININNELKPIKKELTRIEDDYEDSKKELKQMSGEMKFFKKMRKKKTREELMNRFFGIVDMNTLPEFRLDRFHDMSHVIERKLEKHIELKRKLMEARQKMYTSKKSLVESLEDQFEMNTSFK